MASRNGPLFKGPSFEEMLEQAVKHHNDRIVANNPKTYFSEPSQHDILYRADLDRNQTLFFPDGVPVEPSLGLPEPEDIADRIRRQIQGKELARAAAELGMDTFEEALDFQVEDGQDKCPYSGHEYSEQDEVNDEVAYANMLKEREDKEIADAKNKKLQEYQELKAEFEKTTPPVPQPSPGESADK